MQDFWNKLLPGSIKTDHNKFNGADLLIIVLDLILLGYTCYRSFRFLQNTFAGNDTTGEYTIAAIIALVGLDVAAVAWSLVWMFGSTTKWQDVVSLLMFVVSIIGMVLTSMTDTLAGEGTVPDALKFAAYYGVPAIILLNVSAGITYHMISPQVALSRKERRLKADTLETKRLGELAQQDTAMKLEIAEKHARQNDELISRQQRLAQQKITLDGIQLGISRAMSDDDAMKQRGQSVFEQLRNAVIPSASSEPMPQPERVLNATAPILPEQPQVTAWFEPSTPRLVRHEPTPAEQWLAIGSHYPDDIASATDLLKQFPVSGWGAIYAGLFTSALAPGGTMLWRDVWDGVYRLSKNHLLNANSDPIHAFNESEVARFAKMRLESATDSVPKA